MNKPLKAARERGVDIAMWQTKNGGYSFTFRKSYKDKATGEYKESKQFFPEELDILRRLIDEARAWTNESNPVDQIVSNLVNNKPIVDDDIPF